MNSYVTVQDLYTAGRKAAAQDTEIFPWEEFVWLLPYVETASRAVDSHVDRRFYSELGTRRLTTGRDREALYIPDVLSISSLTTDSERDGTWTGEDWTEGADYYLSPFDTRQFPKTQIVVLPDGDFRFSPEIRDNVQISATWGYGDGVSAAPWRVSGRTVTVADDSTSAATVDAEGTIFAGHTLLLGSEQVFVEAASSSGAKTLTLQRQVNGTTAAAHDPGVPASLAQYLSAARGAALQMAVSYWNTENLHGWASEDFDGHRVEMLRKYSVMLDRMLGNFVRIEF